MSRSTHHSRPRLFVSDPLQTRYSVTLSPAQSHYVCTVMRLKAQESEVLLFNGRDGEWEACVEVADRKRTIVTCMTQKREQAAGPDIWLCFAPVKHGKIEYLAQKATELGAAKLVPVKTLRTVVPKVNDKLVSVAIEAAEQSERLTVPEITPYRTLADLLAEWPSDRRLVYGDETGQGGAPMTVLPTIKESKLALLVGPEGGFDSNELAALRQAKFATALSLGPRVLRAETAALAGLTCLMAWCGDWMDGHPHFG